jgi:hypothetical protein
MGICGMKMSIEFVADFFSGFGDSFWVSDGYLVCG